MYGWKGDEVISAVRQNERNVLFLEDRFIRGQAMAWKQLVDAFGSNVKFVSVNVDDLHLAKEIERIKDIKEGVSVKRVSGYRSLNKYTAYDVVGGSLAGVYRSGCIFGVDWYLGTGIYVLNGGCIKYMEEDKEKSEYTADNLINNMIAGGRILKAYEVVTWHDIGNVEGMRKVIEDDRFRI
jgi:NDP-sugar pyrophosphorylase family protein